MRPIFVALMISGQKKKELILCNLSPGGQIKKKHKQRIQYIIDYSSSVEKAPIKTKKLVLSISSRKHHHCTPHKICSLSIWCLVLLCNSNSNSNSNSNRVDFNQLVFFLLIKQNRSLLKHLATHPHTHSLLLEYYIRDVRPCIIFICKTILCKKNKYAKIMIR